MPVQVGGVYNKYDIHERNYIAYVVSILKHARLIFIIRPKFFLFCWCI